MTAPAQGFAACLGDLEAAFEDVSTSALGFGDLAVIARHDHAPEGCRGAYLALVGPAGAVQVGVASDEVGCQALAKALLGMDPSSPELPPEEVADAVAEIVNIVAGGFKARVRDRFSPLQLGLPTFFTGPAQPTERTAVVTAELRVASYRVVLLLVHPRAGERA
ncbi:MAG TPA: chemotaxis protein CheX [Anaeromyxobacteraceae bacterium]|nr:chemotaxis protein CheX [Anaeromyxobacteraceae bacterium]